MRSWSSRYFRIVPRVTSTGALVDRRWCRARRARCAQSIVSATPGGLYSSSSRSDSTAAATWRASFSGHVGRPHPQDRELALEVGVRDPVVEAAALQRVVHVARAVRRDDDDRRLLGAERAELGNRDREVGEDLEQERLELVVGAVDLVDEQHRRRGAPSASVVRDRPQQRPPHEEALGVELVLDDLRRPSPRPHGGAAAGASSPTRRRPARRRCPRSTGAARARRRSSAPAPWRPRSCRRPPRPRAATAASAASRGRSRWRGPRRPGTRASSSAARTSSTVSMCPRWYRPPSPDRRRRTSLADDAVSRSERGCSRR